MDQEFGETGPGTPPGDDNQNLPVEAETPESQPAGDAGEARQGSENAIPHYRVKEMIEASERKWQERYSQAEKQIQSYQSFLKEAQQGMLKSFGLWEDKKPTYLSEDQVQERISSLESKIRQEIQQQQLRAQYESGWSAVAQKYAPYTALPGFQEAVARGWAETGNMVAAADKVVAELKKWQASQSNEYVGEKEGQQRRNTVVRPGGGTGGKGTPRSTREMLEDEVRALRGGGNG